MINNPADYERPAPSRHRYTHKEDEIALMCFLFGVVKSLKKSRMKPKLSAGMQELYDDLLRTWADTPDEDDDPLEEYTVLSYWGVIQNTADAISNSGKGWPP